MAGLDFGVDGPSAAPFLQLPDTCRNGAELGPAYRFLKTFGFINCRTLAIRRLQPE